MSHHEDELYELLKQGSDAGTTLPNNEDQSVSGTTSLYEDPDDQNAAGTTESPWGKEGPKDPYHNTNAAHQASVDVRHGVLERSFKNMPQASRDAKAAISKNFTTRDYTSHSAQLQSKTAQAEPPKASLMESVTRLVGRT